MMDIGQPGTELLAGLSDIEYRLSAAVLVGSKG
jgi:hypothetical protein